MSTAKKDTLSYRCNICGVNCETAPALIQREEPSCPSCRSTVRMRSVVHLLSLELFGKSLVLKDFPVRRDIAGLGMSDWDGYAVPLSKKLNYTNTYYHKEPKLDITSIEPAMEGTLDFLISSDVFEHVAPPVYTAFENARKLLKPTGVFIFTVPYDKEGKTKEHFPDLYKYEIIKKGETYQLINMTKAGIQQVYDNLFFHGGAGLTLEMRVCSERSLREEFAKAGFNEVKIHKESVPEFGIIWSHDYSLPMSASTNRVPPLFHSGKRDILTSFGTFLSSVEAHMLSKLPVMTEELRILKIGPAKIKAGRAFNVQSNGQSAIWVEAENAAATAVIVWGESCLETTYGSPEVLTAIVPKEFSEKPGKIEVYLLDTETGKRSNSVRVAVE